MDRLEVVKEKIANIKSLDLNKVEVAQLKQELAKFSNQLAITLKLPVGTEICRTRVLNDIEKDIPTNSNQISYNPKPSSNYGRAHLIGETVFYGSLSTEKLKHYVNTSFEVFDINDKSIQQQYFVTSRWILQKDVTVIVIGSTLKQDEERMKERQDFFDNLISPSGIDHECCKLFDNFMNEEFSRIVEKGSDAYYKLTASYCSLLFDSGMEGIMYSSVASNGAGVNIVLPRYLIDDGILLPEKVVLGKMYSRYGDFADEYSMIANIENNILKWKEYYKGLPPNMKNYYMGKTDDKSFQDQIPFQNID